MLVLTRKVGDVIAIGDNIKIVVMAIKGKQVRLGVQADRNTVVHREEIYQKIQQEIKAAMQSDMGSTKAAGELLKSVQTAQASEDAEDARRTTDGKISEKKESASKLSTSGATGTKVIRRVEIRRVSQSTSTESDDVDNLDSEESRPKPKQR